MGGMNGDIGRWLSLASLLMGPGLLVIGLLTMAISRSRRARRVHTKAQVTGYKSGSVGGESTRHPQVEFRTADGRTVTGDQRVSVDIGWYPSGGVDIWYDPAEPQRFTSRRGWWDSPGMLLVIVGGVFTVVCVVLFH